jgi:hypothetical protein
MHLGEEETLEDFKDGGRISNEITIGPSGLKLESTEE